MDLLLIIILLAVFLLPSFFMMRSQRRRQAEIQNLQNSLVVGARVVTASGVHGTVTAVRETEVDLEVSPGVEVTLERIAIVRHLTPVTGLPEAADQPGAVPPAQPGAYDGGFQHPENHPENQGFPEGPVNPEDRDDQGDQGLPGNPR